MSINLSGCIKNPPVHKLPQKHDFGKAGEQPDSVYNSCDWHIECVD